MDIRITDIAHPDTDFVIPDISSELLGDIVKEWGDKGFKRYSEPEGHNAYIDGF